MFGLGLWEIAAIALAIVVFVKPSELPRAARAIGRAVRRIRTFSARASAEMRDLGAAMERGAAGPAAGAPSDDQIHPLQTRPTPPRGQDGEAPHGYSEKAASGDAAER